MKQRTGNNRENQSWLFANINKIGKSLARLTKNKREKTKITKIGNERRHITIIPTLQNKKDSNGILFFKCASKFDDLDEVDKVLGRHQLGYM